MNLDQETVKFTTLFRNLWVGGILSVLLFICSGVLAQQAETKQDSVKRINIKAKVICEETGEQLPGAHIFIGDNKRPVTVTDTAGQFSLWQIPAKQWYTVTITYVGYQPLVRKCFFYAEGALPYSFKLKEAILDEVLVQATPPLVVQRKDTTEFNAAAVRLAEDAELQDLLKKLPGFEIIDGKLMANGEEVKKIYLDGTEYAISNPMSLLKELPASIVSKVKLFDDRSEVAKFSGYDDGNKFRSLNIVTKNPNKLKLFGTQRIGCGLPEDFDITDNLNYNLDLSFSMFNPKYRFSGRFNQSDKGRTPALANALFTEMEGDNGNRNWGADFSVRTKKSDNISIGYNGNQNESYSARSNRQDYFPTDRFESRVFNSENHNWSDNNNHNLSTMFQLNLSKRDRMTFRPSISTGNSESRSLSFRSSIENGDTLNETYTWSKSSNEQLRWNGDLTYMHAFVKKGRTLTADMQYSNSVNESEEVQSNRNKDRGNGNQDIFRKGTTERESQNWKAAFSYSEPLTEVTQLAFNYSFDYSADVNDRENYRCTDESFQTIIAPDTSLTSYLKNKNTNHRMGVNYNYHKDKNTFKVGMSMSMREMENFYSYLNRRDSTVRDRYIDFSPRLEGNRRFGEKSYFNFSYTGNSSSPTADQLESVLNVDDPLAISKGNPGLKKRYNQNMDVSYTTSGGKGTYYSLRMSFGNTMNKVATSRRYLTNDTVIDGYQVQKGASFSMPVNLNGDWRFGVNATGSCSIEPLKLRLNSSLSYNYNRTPSVNDEVLNYNRSQSVNLRLSFVSNISETVDFNVNTNSGYTSSRNTTMAGSTGFRETINVGAKWIVFKRLVLGGEYNFLYSQTKSTASDSRSNNLMNLNVGVKVFKKRQGEFRFEASDLLRQRDVVTNNVSELYTEVSNSTIVYTPYSLSFFYRFNRMK